MRVAYLINQYPKVSHSFIRREILALEQRGDNILRIALRGWDDEIVDPEDILERNRTRYVLRDGAWPLLSAAARMLVTRPLRFSRAFRLACSMSRRAERPLPVHLVYLAEACRIVIWLREEQADHLHAHFGTNSAEVAMLANALGGPRWSFTVHGPEEFDKALCIGLAEKIKQAEFVVAVSSYGRSQLYRLVDCALWPKIHVVHCGLDTSFITAKSAPSRTRRLICVGRLCEQKGQLLLIEAAHRLAADGTDLELVLAGDGELRPNIEALIVRHKLQKTIRITGWISGDRVREEILAARALVLPSFAEGLPVVLMEAMALRRPVISTYVAGIPELVVPGEHGWLVPAGDVEALSRAVRVCLDAPAEVLRRMGEAAQQKVLTRHNATLQASQLTALFHSKPESTPSRSPHVVEY
jgi:colanic acid/amylovoran biosynthesis glycosyltransferase